MTYYEIELEIFEGEGGVFEEDAPRPDFANEGICAWMYYGDGGSYQKGQRFKYPEDLGKICPWVVDSVTGVIRALEHGGSLSWKYEGTPYEKEIDPNGITTEFVRCIDPTESGIVIKVIRTAME